MLIMFLFFTVNKNCFLRSLQFCGKTDERICYAKHEEKTDKYAFASE